MRFAANSPGWYSCQRKHAAEILALGPELRLPPSQLKRKWSM